MKINDLNGHLHLDENLLGDFGRAFVQKATGQTIGKGVKSQMAKNTFIKDFIDDALSGLEDAIESGLVDPNIKSEPTQVDPSTVQPQQTQQAQQPKQKRQTQADRRQSIQRLNNYIKKVAQTIEATPNVEDKMKRVKEVINVMADRKDYPEWDNAKKTVQNVIQQTDLDPAFIGSAVKRLEMGKTMTEAWQIYFINQLLEHTNITWEELGLVVLKENNNYYLAESTSHEFESLFESLLNEQPNKKSITQWMTNWFANYMQGIDVSDYADDISTMISAVGWPAKQARPTLEKLARASWAIAKETGADKVGAGQGNSNQAPQPTQQAEPRDMDPEDFSKKVRADLKKLYDMDPNAYNEIAKSMTKK